MRNKTESKNISRKHFIKLFKAASICTTLCMTSAFASTITYAHMGGDPLEVMVADNSTSDDTLIFVNETINDGRYTVILNGVPQSAKEDFLNKISENIDHITSDIPVKFVNPGFVDADKYSYSYSPDDPEKRYDYGQCWLASTSDMLTIGGWAEGLYNPLNNYEGNSAFLSQNFTDEDDLFLYFTSNFGHYADFQKNGISFFFDGLFRKYSPNGTTLTTEKTAFKNSIGTDQEGFYKDIYVKNLLDEKIFTGALNNLSALDDFENFSYGAKADFDGQGGHAITAVGVIIDNEKSGNEKYAAVFIADSDNEDDADTEVEPESMEAAYKARQSRTNSYTMYGLELTKNTDGADAVLLKGYKSNITDKVFLESVTKLPFKSDSVMDSAKETASNATLDAKNNPDYIADSISVLSGGDDTNTIKEGDAISIFFRIANARDGFILTKENAAADFIKNKIEIIKDGELYAEITNGLDIDSSNPGSFNEWQGFTGFLNLKELGIELPAGEYLLKLYVNTDNAPEAYVMNNTPAECHLTVTP